MNHYFIGVKMSPSIKKELKEWQIKLKEYMSYKTWTDEEDFHITLKFLGGCPDERIDHYIRSIQAESWPAPFGIHVGPAGSFGHPKQPRVFHAKVDAPSDLLRMKEKIDDIGKEHGFSIEKRAYRPHVTLAKQQAGGTSPLSRQGSDDSIFQQHYPMVVDEFSVFKINPGKSPKYENIADICM